MIKQPALLIAFLVLVDLTSCVIPIQAQPNFRQQWVSPEKSSDNGIPPKEDRTPLGGRGPCGEINTLFTPLLPAGTNPKFSGFTLSEHPVFWFYVAYKTTNIHSGKFSLEDLEGNSVYRTSFELPKTPGFVSINIPTTEKALDKNKQYRWMFKINLSCGTQDAAPPLPAVWHWGLVQRVDLPTVEAQLRATKSMAERIRLYADNSLWYDAFSDLAQSPQGWSQLLRKIGLEQLNQQPISGSAVPIEKL